MHKLIPSPRALEALADASIGVLDAAEMFGCIGEAGDRPIPIRGDFFLKDRCRRLNDAVDAIKEPCDPPVLRSLLFEGWADEIGVVTAAMCIVDLNDWLLKAWNMADLLADRPHVFGDFSKQRPPQWMSDGKQCIHRPPDWPPGIPTEQAAAVRKAVDLLRQEVARAAPKAESPDRSESSTSPHDPPVYVPIPWLRDVVPQRLCKGDASKLAEWLRRRNVPIFKHAGRNQAEKTRLLTMVPEFRKGSEVYRRIEGYGIDGE